MICASLSLPWEDPSRFYADRVTVTTDWLTTTDGHRSHAMRNVDELEPGLYVWEHGRVSNRVSNSDVYAIDRLLADFDGRRECAVRRPLLETQIAQATNCTALIPLTHGVRVQYVGVRGKAPREWKFHTFGSGALAYRDTVHVNAQYLLEAMIFLGVTTATARFSDPLARVKIEGAGGKCVIIMPVRTSTENRQATENNG